MDLSTKNMAKVYGVEPSWVGVKGALRPSQIDTKFNGDIIYDYKSSKNADSVGKAICSQRSEAISQPSGCGLRHRIARLLTWC